MKKRWFLIAAVAVTAGVVAMTSIPEEKVAVCGVTLRPTRVEQTVSCMGVVESSDGVGVFAPVNCVVRKVNVKEGQRVRKGDVLAILDRDATKQTATGTEDMMVLAAMSETLIAPEDGVVVMVKAAEGRVLEKTTPCVTLAADRDLCVAVSIREGDLRKVKERMVVRVSGDGFGKSAYTGVLTEISSSAGADAGGGVMVRGVVTLDEGQMDSSLRLGLSARVTVVTAVTEKGLVIPYDAVVSDADGSYVLVEQGGCAQRWDLPQYTAVADGVLVVDDRLDGVTVITQPHLVEEGRPVSVQEEGV